MKIDRYIISFIVLALAACGRPEQYWQDTPVDHAIVGGQETEKNNVISKYVVLIYDNQTKTYCTGLLIRKNIILTAAHCVGKNTDALTLAFGLSPMSGKYTLREAKKVTVHEGYKKYSANDRNDVALILIKGEAPIGYVPVALPEETFPLLPGLRFTATGYGRTSGKKALNGDIQGSGILRQVDLEIDSFSQDGNQFYVDQTNSRGICNGDSGGPALMRFNNQDYVVGIASAISWTVPNEIGEDEKKAYIENKDLCSEKSIYMNVKNFRPWIESEILKFIE